MENNSYYNWVFYTYKRAPQLHFKSYTFRVIKLLIINILKDVYYEINRRESIEKLPKNDIWVISNTVNNKKVLSFIVNSELDAEMVGIGRSSKFEYNINFQGKPFKKLLKLISLAFTLNDSWFIKNIHYLYTTILFKEHLQKINRKPSLIIFANDHYYLNRILLDWAKANHIKTAYIPHAFITEVFPPLEFDLAFLYGEEMKNRYLNCGETNTKIILSGSVGNLKQIKRRSLNFNKLHLGLAFNLTDSELEAKQLIKNILKNKSVHRIYIRYHPRLKPYKLNENERVSVCEKDESIHCFFEKIDLVISGNSSIHLEACLNKIPTYLWIGHQSSIQFDYYGFIDSEIALPFQTEFGDNLKTLGEFQSFNLERLDLSISSGDSRKSKHIIINELMNYKSL